MYTSTEKVIANNCVTVAYSALHNPNFDLTIIHLGRKCFAQFMHIPKFVLVLITFLKCAVGL